MEEDLGFYVQKSSALLHPPLEASWNSRQNYSMETSKLVFS